MSGATSPTLTPKVSANFGLTKRNTPCVEKAMLIGLVSRMCCSRARSSAIAFAAASRSEMSRKSTTLPISCPSFRIGVVEYSTGMAVPSFRQSTWSSTVLGTPSTAVWYMAQSVRGSGRPSG